MARPLPSGYSEETVRRFIESGLCGKKPLTDYIRDNIAKHPDKNAFVTTDSHLNIGAI